MVLEVHINRLRFIDKFDEGLAKLGELYKIIIKDSKNHTIIICINIA